MLSGQFSKNGCKGMKMIRRTSEIDSAQLYFCVHLASPHNQFTPYYWYARTINQGKEKTIDIKYKLRKKKL